jgi:hypothetical protein
MEWFSKHTELFQSLINSFLPSADAVHSSFSNRRITRVWNATLQNESVTFVGNNHFIVAQPFVKEQRENLFIREAPAWKGTFDPRYPAGINTDGNLITESRSLEFDAKPFF